MNRHLEYHSSELGAELGATRIRPNTAALDEYDLAGDSLDVRHDMRRQNHRALLRKPMDDVAEAHSFAWIESCSGLIKNEDLGIGKERSRDADALNHAARELAHATVCRIVQPYQLKQLIGSARDVALVHSLQGAHVAKERPRRIAWVVSKLLGQATKSSAVSLPHCMDILAVPADSPLGWKGERGKYLEKRRFAGSVWCYQTGYALGKRKRRVLDHNVTFESLGHVLDGKHGASPLRVFSGGHRANLCDKVDE